MHQTTKILDLLILGTGPAASRVASKCAETDWHIGIVDPRPYGGTCALRGCNPKKVLVRAAELVDWVGRMENKGVRSEGAIIDWREMIAFKRTFTESVTSHNESMFEDLGIVKFHGNPRFLTPDSVDIEGQKIQARHFVVATGAVPTRLGIPGENYLANSDEFLEMDHLPKRLLFIGGGYVTFEFAHVAVRAGAEVSIIENSDRPLSRFDSELVDALVERTCELGIELRTETEVKSIKKNSNGSLAVEVTSDGSSELLEADLVVHGAGRVPNTDDLDLERADVRYGPEGIEVDEYLQSVSNSSVYAAGDVAANGEPLLSPVAREDGQTLAENLLSPDNRRKPNYGPVATVVFSVPALASVGLDEERARRAGLRFSVNTGDRSLDHSMQKVGEQHARYKVLVEEESDRVLGAQLLGPDAAETINLFALAIKHRISARELRSMLFASPTFIDDVRFMV
ncbi:MAG: NAD(P)/FAD-dependent oxidoreductase [Pirellulales bacterium]|nr:NAD(P)/FAD-dependent oxidoreductase [Pirellulales bacterium]